MNLGEIFLGAAALIIGTLLVTTLSAFFAWMYEDWKKHRRDW
jgi:hypothetical protein